MLAATSASLAPLARQRRITSSAISWRRPRSAKLVSLSMMMSFTVPIANRCDVLMRHRDLPHATYPMKTLPPSRSQQRRDALEIFKLAETLAALSDAELARVPLADELRDEVRARARSPRTSRASARRSFSPSSCASSTTPILEPIRAALEHDRAEGASRRGRAAPARNLAHAPDRRRRRGARRAARAASCRPIASICASSRATRVPSAMRDKPLHAYRELFRALRELFDGPASSSGESRNPVLICALRSAGSRLSPG